MGFLMTLSRLREKDCKHEGQRRQAMGGRRREERGEGGGED